MRDLAQQMFHGLLRGLPDRLALQLLYFRHFGRFPDLRAPTLFTERLQAKKLADRRAGLGHLVDKILVKKHVEEVLGPDWVIATLWEGERVTEDVLKNVPEFSVLKASHLSGKVIFIDRRSDFRHLCSIANSWIQQNHASRAREWAYAEHPPRLLIEENVGNPTPPPDYKIFCFHGFAFCVQVDTDRFSRHTRSYYSRDWQRLPVSMNYPGHPEDLPKPAELSQLLWAAERMAEGHEFARIDLFATSRGPKFGEFTLYPEAGFCHFKPRGFDAELGRVWLETKATRAA